MNSIQRLAAHLYEVHRNGLQLGMTIRPTALTSPTMMAHLMSWEEQAPEVQRAWIATALEVCKLAGPIRHLAMRVLPDGVMRNE